MTHWHNNSSAEAEISFTTPIYCARMDGLMTEFIPADMVSKKHVTTILTQQAKY